MYAPPSWGLARQEHARSPTIRHCSWSFMSGFFCKKNVKKDCGWSKKKRNDIPVASTPFVLDVSKDQSCIDLSANAQPNKRIKDSSDLDPYHLDNGCTKRVTSKSKLETEQSTAPTSTSSVSTTPEEKQPALPQRPPRARTSATTKEHTPTLPNPSETPLRIYRQTKTLTLDSHSQATFKTSRQETSISALPFNEQNAAYDHALTKILPTNHTLSRGCATLQSDIAKKVLSHYHLHLSRLAFTRLTIKSLAQKHRTSARLAYRSTMSSWGTGLLQDPGSKPSMTALATFRQRATYEREERGIIALLERCEQFLSLQEARFKADDRQPAARKARRWKEGRNGWVGLDVDDGRLRLDRREGKGEAGSHGRALMAKKGLKEAFTRAAAKAMGKEREVSSVFARAKLPGGK